MVLGRTLLGAFGLLWYVVIVTAAAVEEHGFEERGMGMVLKKVMASQNVCLLGPDLE